MAGSVACESTVVEDVAPAPSTILFRIDGHDSTDTSLVGQCLELPLPRTADGDFACTLIEASNGLCACDAARGRRPLDDDDDARTIEAIQGRANDPAWTCFCEIAELEGPPESDCLDQPDSETIDSGWCYIDATTSPPIGDPGLLSGCPDHQRRLVRFTGDAAPPVGAAAFMMCVAE